MSTRHAAPLGSGAPTGGHGAQGDPADRAYRRAWWSVALYPVSFVVAFLTGEGILSTLTKDISDPAFWQVLVAGIPAFDVSLRHPDRPRDQPIMSKTLKIGMYRATIIDPTTPPRKAIIRGSIMAVSDSVVVSTSSS